MSSFFTPKMRQEGFAPSTSPGPSPPAPGFDAANMFFAHHIFPHHQPPPPHPDPPRVDFGDELAAMLAPRPASPPHQPPHNPFDTNSTAPYRTHPHHQPHTHPHHHTHAAAAPPPHNIFDVGAPAPFPAHFSLPEHSHAAYAYPDFRPPSRSRSRSKTGRGRIPAKKRASVSSAHSPSPPRPHAILIPPPGPSSPLALHMHAQTAPSAWFAADSPFSLPTPDSVGVSHFGQSPRSASAKESPPPDAASKQAQLASEKRRRRRESHNAVERRRRDNINEKISELATLIPECMLDPSAGADGGLDGFAGVPHADEDGDRKDAAGAVKANKGMILRKSVEYIRYLQQLVNAQATRNRELEAQLASGPGAHHALPHADDGMAGLVLGMEDDALQGMVGMASPPEEAEEGSTGGSPSASPPEGPVRGRTRGVRVKREEGGAEGVEGEGAEEGEVGEGEGREEGEGESDEDKRMAMEE